MHSFRTSTNKLTMRLLILSLTLVLWGCSGSNSSSPESTGVNMADEPSDEITANPVLIATEATLQIIPDKTFRISWQPRDGAQSYRVFENPDGVAGYTPISEILDAETLTFDHRVALYLRINARYLVQACFESGCVNSEPEIVQGTLDDAVGYIKASNAEGGYLSPGFGESATVIGGDKFGASLSLSADGNTLAVAAPGEDSGAMGVNGNQADNTDEDTGAVYVFIRDDERWRQQAYLKADRANRQCCLGGDVVLRNTSLSLSGDGNTLAVGSGSFNRITGADYTGEVYLFMRTDSAWQQLALLESRYAVDEQGNLQGNSFGQSLDLTHSGDTLAVGAPSEGVGGTAYVFTRSDDEWVEKAYLEASNTTRNFRFGSSIAISDDGQTLAVGADGESSLATGIITNPSSEALVQDFSNRDSGAAYIFESLNGSWEQQAILKASNAAGGDQFGGAVAISANGSTLAISASSEDGSSTGVNNNQQFISGSASVSTGAVYVFTRSDRRWNQQAYLKASNSGLTPHSQFGTAISLSTDGNTLAIGARGEAGIANGINGDQYTFIPSPAAGQSAVSLYVGAAYVFTRTVNEWQQVAYVKATNNTSNSEYMNIRFGEALSLSGDGQTLAVGANEETGGVSGINGDRFDRSAPGAGAVFVY